MLHVEALASSTHPEDSRGGKVATGAVVDEEMEQNFGGASRSIKRQRCQDTGSSSSSNVVIKQERRGKEGSRAPKVVKPASSCRWRPRGDARARIRRQEPESMDEACGRMFADAREGGGLTDMEFVLDSGRRIKGHQSWLMARCGYLREVLSGRMEKVDQEGGGGTMRVRGCGEGSFLVLLEFIYTGRLGEGVCEEHDFGELFMLADMFCMEGMAARLMEAGTQVRAQGSAGRERSEACGDDGEDRGREPGDGKRRKVEEKRGELGGTSEGRGGEDNGGDEMESEDEGGDAGHERRCTYDGCLSPDESYRFYKIGDRNTAGGRDWSSLHGRVLCHACYIQYRTRGTLERGGRQGVFGGRDEEEMESEDEGGDAGYEKRCTYDGCLRPEESSYFRKIGDHITAGGQDWSSLHGQVLCASCYTRYKNRGTLERKRAVLDPHMVKRCTYEGCRKPDESSYFCKIDERITAGGQNWRPLHGRVLCEACYTQYRLHGTLERARGRGELGEQDEEEMEDEDVDFPTLFEGRCTYKGCSRPEESRQFYKIGDHTTAGGQDWSPLHGRVLCIACYVQYRKKGTLERGAGHGQPAGQDEDEMESEDEGGDAGYERRCTYDGCLRPEESRQSFHKIGDRNTAGGQDWTPLRGQVLCDACYKRYCKRGTLERARGQGEFGGEDEGEDEMESEDEGGDAGYERRCTYDGCLRPEESYRFRKIGNHITAGGQDWTPLHGQVLCNACYEHHRRHGTLERARGQGGQGEEEMESGDEGGDAGYERRCTYEGCRRPDESSRFHKIGDHITAGDQDWSSLHGQVLCDACCLQYLLRGTLKRGRRQRELGGEVEAEMESEDQGEDAGHQRCCTYKGCSRPEESTRFHKIGDHITAGGQDWSPLHDQVLCNACYIRYRRHGTLERARGQEEFEGEDEMESGDEGGGAGYERRCTYEGCRRPDESSRFCKIGDHNTAGGQDWRPLHGQVLCDACYIQYRTRGTLERGKGQGELGGRGRGRDGE